MAQEVYYLPIRKSDVSIGRPLPWSIYNGDHQLLLKRGCVVDTQAQLDRLFQEGLYRDSPVAIRAQINAAGRAGTEADEVKEDAQPDRLIELDEIRPAIGDVFNVQIQSDRADSRYFVRLIGYLKNKSVIVSSPEQQGNLVYVKEGQVFVVRFFSGKNAYAFTSNVIRVSNAPYPHLHLGYPNHVKGLVVRAGERVPVKMICAVSSGAGNEVESASFSGVLQNLSVGGAQLSSKQRLGKKEETVCLKFRLHIGAIENYMVLDAEICSVQTSDEGDNLYGLKFVNVRDDDVIALTAFVYQRLAEVSTA